MERSRWWSAPAPAALYLRVINDATLLDWADPPIEQANLGAYARFKLVVLYTQTGRQKAVISTVTGDILRSNELANQAGS